MVCTLWRTLSDTSLVSDVGGEEHLSHVHSVGRSVTHATSGDGGGEENLWHVHSGGWERRRGSVVCTQVGMLSDIYP